MRSQVSSFGPGNNVNEQISAHMEKMSNQYCSEGTGVPTCHTGAITGACNTVEGVVAVDKGVEGCRGQGGWADRSPLVQALQQLRFQLIRHAYKRDLHHKSQNRSQQTLFLWNLETLPGCLLPKGCLFGKVQISSRPGLCNRHARL